MSLIAEGLYRRPCLLSTRPSRGLHEAGMGVAEPNGCSLRELTGLHQLHELLSRGSCRGHGREPLRADVSATRAIVDLAVVRRCAVAPSSIGDAARRSVAGEHPLVTGAPIPAGHGVSVRSRSLALRASLLRSPSARGPGADTA